MIYVIFDIATVRDICHAVVVTSLRRDPGSCITQGSQVSRGLVYNHLIIGNYHPWKIDRRSQPDTCLTIRGPTARLYIKCIIYELQLKEKRLQKHTCFYCRSESTSI